MDVTSPQLWSMFTTECALLPDFQRAFLMWARLHHPDEWERFAVIKRMAVDDPALVIAAAEETAHAVLEFMRTDLDRLSAVVETRQILGEL